MNIGSKISYTKSDVRPALKHKYPILYMIPGDFDIVYCGTEVDMEKCASWWTHASWGFSSWIWILQRYHPSYYRVRMFPDIPTWD